MNEKKNIFSNFTKSLLDLPLWVKQILFLTLRENIDSYLPDDLNFTKKKDILQFYVPELSFKGKNELAKREKGFEINIYKFLESAARGCSIIDMAINNYWTLEECSKLLMTCMQQEFLQQTNSPALEATAGFISGELRIGEYFKSIGKIDADSLTTALQTQKSIEESSGDRIGIARVLINMNLITEKDTKALLHIKDEAGKRFILDYNLSSFSGSTSNKEEVKPQPVVAAKSTAVAAASIAELEKLKLEHEKLKQENKLLKEQLFKILKIKK